MLRKRISSILVAGVVAISMTGCNVKDTYKQLLEQELQRIESTEPIEYELPQMEQEAKEVESKVKEQKSRQELYNEVNQGKVEQEAKEIETKVKEQPKQQVKQEQPNQQVNDEEQPKQEINDEEQVKSGHTAYDESDDRINDVIDEREDYWHTDGDVPNNEPTTEESNEPKVIINVQDIQESQEYVEQFNN